MKELLTTSLHKLHYINSPDGVYVTDLLGGKKLTENSMPYNIPRGYTMHEHLDEFGLINMNSRLYSPYLSRFLAPDPYIQDPTNSQNFNRYSYCLNNPLKYTDPSGENWKPWILGAFLLDPVSFCVTVCATATAATGLFTTITASGLMPFQGTLFALSIPSKNYDKKYAMHFKLIRVCFELKTSGIGTQDTHGNLFKLG